MTFDVAFIERVSESVAIIRVKNSTITAELVNKDVTILISPTSIKSEGNHKGTRMSKCSSIYVILHSEFLLIYIIREGTKLLVYYWLFDAVYG